MREALGWVRLSHLCGGGPERIGGGIGIPGPPSLSRILNRNNKSGSSRGVPDDTLLVSQLCDQNPSMSDQEESHQRLIAEN